MAQGTPTSTPAAPRTGLYTGVTKDNAAADRTVSDYSMRPTLIGDRQYFAGFGGTDMGNAAFSMKGKGFNWFGEVTGPVGATGRGTNPDSLRLGLGSGSAWGAGVILAVNRVHGKGTVGVAAGDTTTYIDGSGIGLFGDMNLGNSDAYASVGWATGFPPTAGQNNSVTLDPDAGTKTENFHHYLSVALGWKKEAAGEGTHAFGIDLSYLFSNHTIDATGLNVDDKINLLSLMPKWGYVVRENADYSVFIGTNARLFLENDDIAPEKGNQYGVSVTPNIAFQKQFGHGFEGFSGFSVTARDSIIADEPADNAEFSQILTGEADVAVGLRWVKDNFALEGSLRESVLANGPYLIGGNTNQGLFANIGMALGF